VPSSAGTLAPLIEPQSAWNIRVGRPTGGLEPGRITVQKQTLRMAWDCAKIRIPRPNI